MKTFLEFHHEADGNKLGQIMSKPISASEAKRKLGSIINDNNLYKVIKQVGGDDVREVVKDYLAQKYAGTNDKKLMKYINDLEAE